MENRKTLVVLISGNGTNLQAIIDSIHKRLLPLKITAVISNRENAYGLQRAKLANLNSHIISAKDFSNRKSYDQALADYICQFKPDIIALAGFMHILGMDFLKRFENKIINIHPSLLPNYPGLNTHSQAIADGGFEHGCSIHFVNENLDAGPIIAQAVVKVKKDDTVQTLKQRVQLAEHFLYPTVLNWLSQERVIVKGTQATIDNISIPSTGLRFNIQA